MAKEVQEIKLTVELIPKTCHYSNVRTSIKSSDWDKIRLYIYEKAQYKCEICGDTGLKQGYKHSVECHEIWKYNDKKKIQKLIGFMALCPLCHQVKHAGRSMAMGKQNQLIQRIRKINQWDQSRVDQYLAESFEVNKERSTHEWALDLKLISKPPFNIQLKDSPERKFKVKAKKRRRRSKKAVKKSPKKFSKRPSKKS
jgi:5-methylcytosine-specific restriction endonuclease McrA